MTNGAGAEIHFNDGSSGFAGLIAFSKAMARDQRVSNPQGECNPVAVTCAANRDAVALNCDIERPVHHEIGHFSPARAAVIPASVVAFRLSVSGRIDAAPQRNVGYLTKRNRHNSFTDCSNPEPPPQQLGSGA